MPSTIEEPARRDRTTLDRLLAEPGGRVLVQGASIVSMDPDVGDLAQGDLLIEGTKIAAVGADLSEAANDGQALVVDATGTVMIPGLQDAHRHCWQTQLRRLFPDIGIADYMGLVHFQLGPAYEAHDMYVGNLLAAQSALDAGITTVLDFSHNSRSRAHSDAVVRAWKESGVRAVVASCVPLAGEWDGGWRDDLVRLRSEHFASDDQLLTLRMGLGARVADFVVGDLCLSPESIRYARDLGIGIHVDAVSGSAAAEHILELEPTGELGADITWIHCNALNDDAWSAIAGTGGQVVLATTSDAQLGIEGSIAPIQEALDRGIKPALSVDVECSLTSDLFTQMQATLNVQRMMAHHHAHLGDANPPAPMPARDALELATVAGAKANGVWHRAGSLTPGKEADVVLIDAGALNTLPLNNAVATVVLGSDTRNVDTVFVAGRPRKWAGTLVETDVARLRDLATASRDQLLERIGHQLDVTA